MKFLSFLPLLSLMLLAGCEFFELPGHSASLPAQPPALTVGVMSPLIKDVTDYEEFTGWTEAVEAVQVRAQVSGVLAKVCFTPGAEAKAGDVFFELEPEVFIAERDRAKAELAVLEARLPRLKSEVTRAEKLKPSGAISDEDYEKIQADLRECVAQIASAKADLDRAEINVNYTKIRSPIDGVVGRNLVTVGNLVNASTTLLAEMVSQDPIYVIFNVDEGTLLQLMRRVEEGRAAGSDFYMDVTFRLSDSGKTFRGRINYYDPYMDKSAGTLLMRAQCANPKNAQGQRELMPGMMVHVQIPVTGNYTAMVIPDEATGSDQGRRYVYVLDEDGTATMRHITTGPLLENNMRVVRRGLKETDTIIVDNLLRIRPGTNVSPIPTTVGELRGEGKAKIKRTAKESDTDGDATINITPDEPEK